MYACLATIVWSLTQWCCTLTVYPALVGIWWTALSGTILPVACNPKSIQNSLWKHIKEAFVMAFQRATLYLYALFPELAVALKWHLLEKAICHMNVAGMVWTGNIMNRLYVQFGDWLKKNCGRYDHLSVCRIKKSMTKLATNSNQNLLLPFPGRSWVYVESQLWVLTIKGCVYMNITSTQV